MAKKSQKRSVRQERGQSGCMWGFISMFDFRHGRSTHKLLSDKRRGTRHIAAAGLATDKTEMLINLDENSEGTVDSEEIMTVAADASKLSVKKLMEDEMFCEKDSKKVMHCAKVESNQSQSEHGGQKRKNRKRTNRSRTKSCEIYTENLDAAREECEKPCLQCLEKQSASCLDIDDMMEDFCRQIHNSSGLEQDHHGDVRNQSEHKNPEFQEKLRVAIKIFIRQRLINGKRDSGEGYIHPSRELKDALKNLTSDEELSLEILHDLKSGMVKYVEDLLNAQVEKDEVSSNLSNQEVHNSNQNDEVVRSKQRKFFRRKAKTPEKTSSDESNASQALNRIVILKPGPTGVEKPESEGTVEPSPKTLPLVRNKGPDERAGAHFFFSEIKRKLIKAMGKEQQEVAYNGTSKILSNKHRAKADTDKRYKENIGRKSLNKDHFFIEKMARPSAGVKKGEKTDKLKDCENDPKQRVSNIYVEAKKHLSEMLTTGSSDVDFSSRQVPKTLGKILSLPPEYNFSPLGSPERVWEQNFVTAQMILSANDRFQKQENNVSPLSRMTLNSETDICVSDESANSKAEVALDPNASGSTEVVQDIELEKISCSIDDGMASEGDVEIVKAYEIEVQEEIDVPESLFELSESSASRDDQNCGLSEASDVKDCYKILKLESLEEIESLCSLSPSPSFSSITKKDDDLEGSAEVTDRPSPVSVLEPLFIEDDISPTSTRSKPAEVPLQPIRIQFEEIGSLSEDFGTHLKAFIQDKESVLEYIKEVLETSEVDWDEFYTMSNSSDPILDPSVCDEVRFFPNQLCYDKKLLFDCINEVLMEVYGRYFGCPLGLSFGKPIVRRGPDVKNAIHEVWEGVYWYLLPLPLPRTLEQIVKKDMAKTGSWMDLRWDSESMVIEIGESIFEELIEETMSNCVNESLKGGNDLTLVELKDESNN
ncbi:uncharacterized protein LOC126686378 [Mercurialis annua]|uniref:uncharacterized protein LOC126686378 n=1 Tax=Mercurialis annua TaxID=3986 RepID=UPI00216007B8|nr:uncharacterized protein LOC126686378 [Mercurialis annua]XP_050236374.1 uncharacterized protein LOC126686378 [Mercurialis annua]